MAVPSAAQDGAPQASPASGRWQEQIKQKMQTGIAILDRQFLAGIKNVAYPQLLLKKNLSTGIMPVAQGETRGQRGIRTVWKNGCLYSNKSARAAQAGKAKRHPRQEAAFRETDRNRSAGCRIT
jgi:hypothetical protein